MSIRTRIDPRRPLLLLQILSIASTSISGSCSLSKVSFSTPHHSLAPCSPHLLVKLIDIDCSKWQILYLAKLKACHKIADFSDSKKDQDLKEQKKECLIEIIDVLDETDAIDHIIKERVLEAAMQMISVNLFRTFANKSKLEPQGPL